MNIRFFIVDDEPLAHRVIERYTQDISFLQKVGQAYDALAALTLLQQLEVDLLFLDIKMPKLKGLDLLRSLRHPPQVIVTTAYREYALEGYELNVCDYLLKPFSFERFLQAIQKIELPASTTTTESFFVKTDKQHIQISLPEIDFIEAYGSYIKIYRAGKMVLVKDKISAFAERLPSDRFLRVHKSYLVSLQKIRAVEGNRLWIGQREIPIGATYRSQLREMIQ